jgi:hypothetical protein
MSNDKTNITIGLPKPGGAIFWAPAGTPVPTDADEALNGAFVNLGFVTEDGLTASTEEEGDTITAWGPEDVMQSQTRYSRTFTFNLLETSRESALKFRYGDENVTVGLDGSIKVNDTGVQAPRGVFVVDTLQNNGSDSPRIHRQVAGDAQLTDRSGDQVYNNSDPVNIPSVLRAFKYTQAGVTATNGDYVTEYWSTATES